MKKGVISIIKYFKLIIISGQLCLNHMNFIIFWKFCQIKTALLSLVNLQTLNQF